MSVYLGIKNANFVTNSVDLLTAEEKAEIVAAQTAALEIRKYVWMEFPSDLNNEARFSRNTLRSALVVPKASVFKASGVHVASNASVLDGDDLLFLPRGCKTIILKTAASQSDTGCGFEVVSSNIKLLYNAGWKNAGQTYTYNIAQYSGDSDLYLALGFSGAVGGEGVTPATYGFTFEAVY